MEEKRIIVYVDMFAMTQPVMYRNGTQVKKLGDFYLDDLTNTLVEICVEYGVEKIHLFGSQDYLTRIADDIEENAKTKYKRNNIEVEIN